MDRIITQDEWREWRHSNQTIAFVQSLLNLKQQVKHDVIELTINENHHLATLKAGAIIGLDDAIELTKLGEEEEEVDRVEH